MAPVRRKKTSQTAIPLGEILKLAGSIVGVIGGLTAFLSFMGFVIALSFISSQQLYGIPNFAEQFFKEAAVKFVDDLFVILQGWRILAFLSLLGILFLLSWLSRAGRIDEEPEKGSYGSWLHDRFFRSMPTRQFKRLWDRWRPWFSVVYPAVLSIAAVGALALLFMLDSDFSKIESNKLLLYWICLPMLLAVFLHLLFHARDLATGSQGGKLSYSGFLVLFVALALSLPFSYGKNVFDFQVYRVLTMDSKTFSEIRLNLNIDPEKFENLTSMTVRESPLLRMMHGFGATARNAGEVVQAEDYQAYYVMFHTSGKEVLMVPSFTDYAPLKFVLIDENLTSFIELVAGVDRGSSGPAAVSSMTFRQVLDFSKSSGKALAGKPLSAKDLEKYKLDKDLVKQLAPQGIPPQN